MKKYSFVDLKRIILLLTLLTAILSSCKTDFELNAPYKETLVVYGFLNSADTVAQYIRVSKGFLGEGDALIMAQQPDSINYADILDVRLEEVVNGVTLNTYLLDRVDSIPKDEGIFAYPYQVYFVLKNQRVNPSNLYRLVVRNSQTGNTATSTTRIIRDLNLSDIINPSPADADFAPANKGSVKFNSVPNGRVYDVVIRFHYTEDSSGVLSYHFVDWNFSDQFVTSGAELIFSYSRPDFYKLLASAIPVKNGVTRTVGNAVAGYPAIEFRMMAGTEDFHTYMELNSPSNTSLQDPPLFTTLENGLGLFTSRLIHIERRNLINRSLDTLQNGYLTKDLF